MVGLRSIRSGRLLKKPSELWASHEHLLWRFRSRCCNGLHDHDTIEGGESKPSQVWTWNFVRILADGIADLIRFEIDAAKQFSKTMVTGANCMLRQDSMTTPST